MAIKLKCDNRTLTKNAKFSYLAQNYASGVTSLVIVNSNGFAANDHILLGEFGNETTEIVKPSVVTASTHTLTVPATKFAHAESTRVTIIPYNQVKFYYTATATYDTNNEIQAGYLDVAADEVFTTDEDTSNTTGFGWFVFFNSETNATTTNSNAIPYADFASNSVKKIFDSFFSLLNNTEQKLISNSDAFRWLNEGYSMAQNELNLVNREYKATSTTITTTATTAEYTLPTDFSDMSSLTDDNNDLRVEIEEIKLSDFKAWGADTGNNIKYYLRGAVIGFSPTPATGTTTTYTLYYIKKSDVLTSYYDNIDLPENNFYPLVDFMLYRANEKLNKPNPKQYLESFRGGLNLMKVTAIKRSENLDSWSIDQRANV